MGKITEEQLNDTLEAFAAALGLEWHRFSQRLSGSIDTDFVKTNESTEITSETKDAPEDRQTVLERYYLGFGYGTYAKNNKRPQVATVLGKINAIADHLGVDFEVQPERVVTTPTKVKAVKKTTTKKSKVTTKRKK